MLTIYLIRHAESLSNAGASDSLDSPLSPHGRQQAARVAAALRHVPLRAVYSSPLRRAMATAQVLVAQRNGLPLRIEPDLVESFLAYQVAMKDFHTQSLPDVAREFPAAQLPPGPPRPPHAGWWPQYPETVDAFRGRLQRALDRLLAEAAPDWRQRDANVALVSHGDPCARFIEVALGLPTLDGVVLEVKNASITELAWTASQRILRRFSDTSHLDEDDRPRPGEMTTSVSQ